MAISQTKSVLQRKIAAGREGPKTGERTALRALRLAFARAAADVCDLALGVIGATQRRAGADSVAEFIRDDWLLLLLDGPALPSGPQTGALLLHPDCVAAFIQHLTMGAVIGGPTAKRSFTATDAAMIGPLIDGALTRAADLVQVAADARCLEGYSFGARAEDARTLSLAFEADKFRIFELGLDFAGGVVQGAACLILPVPPDLPKAPKGKSNGPRLGDAIGETYTEMTAVIGRIQMTVAELSAMAPGDVFPLPQARLDRTELLSITGQPLTIGQLGKSGGFRAIRLGGKGARKSEETDDFDASAGLTVPEPKPGPTIEEASEPTILEDTTLNKPDTAHIPEFDEDEDDALFDSLSVDEAVLEISELAGLPIPGVQKGQAEDTETELRTG